MINRRTLFPALAAAVASPVAARAQPALTDKDLVSAMETFLWPLGEQLGQVQEIASRCSARDGLILGQFCEQVSELGELAREAGRRLVAREVKP